MFDISLVRPVKISLKSDYLCGSIDGQTFSQDPPFPIQDILKQGCYRSGKSGEKNRTGNQGKVREFRRWSGKNIKSLYTNKLTAAAPSPSLQMMRRIFYFCVVKDHLSQSFCTY
ncbi:hypothetical protein J6590_008184 [Homalodisca vitripennis]|nr:hypothetical protein J6590_008184 [Homalodisca vitripennis]